MTTLNQEVNSMLTKKNRPSYHKDRVQFQRQRHLAIERPDLKNLTRKERRALQFKPFSVNRMAWKYACWLVSSQGSIDGEIRDMFVNDRMNLDVWSNDRIDDLNAATARIYDAIDEADREGNGALVNKLQDELDQLDEQSNTVQGMYLNHSDRWLDVGFFIASPILGLGYDRFEADLISHADLCHFGVPSYVGTWELADGLKGFDADEMYKVLLGHNPMSVLMGE